MNATSVYFRLCVLIAGGLFSTSLGCEFFSPCGLPADTDGSIPATVPDFCASSFTEPTVIDHPYHPLVAGTTRTYQGETPDGTERIVIEVLDQTRVVLGVTCRVVRDRAYLEDILVEDTIDWFAQDDAGNVWYMGEEVDNYNYDDQGVLIDITHEGAWEAGKDIAGIGTIARPGINMKATLAAGDIYHQEYYEGDAEDEAEIIALSVSLTLADDSTYECLQTRDFTMLDATVNEYKYYAEGIGLVVEEPVDGGERIELVSVEP